MVQTVPFTEHPDVTHVSVVFTNPTAQAVTCTAFLISISVISFLLGRRTHGMSFFSLHSWRTISMARMYCIGTFITSWAFIFTAGVIIFGVGMSRNTETCLAGIMSCLTFYVFSKFVIFLFLLERIYVVSGHPGPRLTLPVYLICLLFVLAFPPTVLILGTIGRVTELDEEGACHIGLKAFVTGPLITYDILLNILLTTSFIVPLRASKFVNAKLRAVAIRSLAASFGALTASTLNIGIVTAYHGQQLGWVCLLCCTIDVLINALILYWVTSHRTDRAEMGGYVENSGTTGGTEGVVDATGLTGRELGEWGIGERKDGAGGKMEQQRAEERKSSLVDSARQGSVTLSNPGAFSGGTRRGSVVGLEEFLKGKDESVIWAKGFNGDVEANIVEEDEREGEGGVSAESGVMGFEAFLRDEGEESPTGGKEAKEGGKKAWATKKLERILFGDDKKRRRRSSVPNLPSPDYSTTRSLSPPMIPLSPLHVHIIPPTPFLNYQDSTESVQALIPPRRASTVGPYDTSRFGGEGGGGFVFPSRQGEGREEDAETVTLPVDTQSVEQDIR